MVAALRTDTLCPLRAAPLHMEKHEPAGACRRPPDSGAWSLANGVPAGRSPARRRGSYDDGMATGISRSRDARPGVARYRCSGIHSVYRRVLAQVSGFLDNEGGVLVPGFTCVRVL